MTKQKRQFGIGIIIIAFSFLMTSCQSGRFLFDNSADINNHKKFQLNTFYR